MEISEAQMRRHMISFYGHNPEWDNVPLRDLHFISKERFHYLLNGFSGIAAINLNPQDASKPLLAPPPTPIPRPPEPNPSENITSFMSRSPITRSPIHSCASNIGDTQFEHHYNPSPDYDPYEHFFDQDTPRHIQYHAIQQMSASSMVYPRSLYISFKETPHKIDHFFSEIVPARVDSLFWDIKFAGNSYGFVNFLLTSDADAFRCYFNTRKDFHSLFHVEFSSKIIPINRLIAEASITNGATRILRVNEVPLNFTATRIWNINSSPACGFRFVKLLRQGVDSCDYGLEFNSIGNAIHARRRISAHPLLTRCGFVWMENKSDRVIAAFTSQDIKLDVGQNETPVLSAAEILSLPRS